LHVDGAVMALPPAAGQAGGHVRGDIACTLFLSEPEEYDGGELVVSDTYGEHEVKLPAGDLVVYPASSRHAVQPVTRGTRLASFFWVQSMVRDDSRRRLLFEMDTSIQTLTDTGAEARSVLTLTSIYHNLLRLWAET
jgi:PKHD-type hydroxylase